MATRITAKSLEKKLALDPETINVEPEGWEGPINWSELFGNVNPVELELGAGKGRFILEHARRDPERNYFAIERALKYCRVILYRACRDNLTNLRTYMHDGVEFLEKFCPDASLDALYIFYSDPWPKKRHRKRRVFQEHTVPIFERKLKPGCKLIVKMDYESYFWEIDALLHEHTTLQILESGEIDPVRFEPAFRTNFEVKLCAQGAKVFYLEALKKA
ncbi:tRNA (guanosine(46)-N7)-methyltransferase TrmB [Candidatus Sumerlaeota bacterium]|nr:tRNA (guanosine(46)-N7)-methyltransferase TrmB [Candidatus Sumerlaeota bacterium]